MNTKIPEKNVVTGNAHWGQENCYMKESVCIHSELYQAFRNMEVNMHIADISISLLHLTCRINSHPVWSSDLNVNIRLF